MLETMMHVFVEKVSSNVALLLLAGLTVTTSGVAGAKLYTEYTSPPATEAMEVKTADSPEVLGVTDEVSEPESSVQTSQDSSGTSSIDDTEVLANVETNTDGTTFPTANSVSNSPVVNSGSTTANVQSCIVTIFGKNYDVQPLRSTHPGGDVFKCDTDMSSTYQSAHGTNVSMLSAYETQAGLGTSNSTSGTSSTSTNTGFEHEEEHEDREYEEERENHYEDDHEDHDEDHEDEHHESFESEHSDD